MECAEQCNGCCNPAYDASGYDRPGDWRPDVNFVLPDSTKSRLSLSTQRALENALEDLLNANRFLPEITHEMPVTVMDKGGRPHRIVIRYPATVPVFSG